MMMQVKNGRTAEAAKDMAEEFRRVRKEAHDAIMSRSTADFRMYAAQMKSLLLLEFQDLKGEISRVITYLTEDEQRNPYNLTLSEQLQVSIWMKQALQQTGGLH